MTGLLSFGMAGGLAAQGTSPVLQFSLDREGPPPTQYTLRMRETGKGTYVPHVLAPGAGQAAPLAVTNTEAREISVNPGLVKKMFAAVPMVEGGRCETHSKGIAKTGVKVLQYTSPARQAECSYNYSDDERVNEATAVFEGVAATLEYGDRLRAKLRFDRLGLDAELDGLQSAIADQRALEVGNISEVLNLIVTDDRVMDRVRRKAEHLLQSVPPAQTADAGASSPR